MAVATLRRLTADQVREFRYSGFLVVEDVIPRNDIERLAEHIDLIAAGKASHIPATSIQLEKIFRDGERAVTDQVMSVRKLYNLAVYDEFLWGHVTNPAIVDIMADLFGTDDIKMYLDQVLMKPAEYGATQPWHQDSASWRDIFPMDLISAWCAIDHATTDNGCLHFAPGTHRWGMLSKHQLEPFLPLLGTPEWPIVPAPLRPGGVSFHHSLVLHMSKPNTSGKRRRGYVVHYMRAMSRKDESVTDAPKVPPFKQVRGRSFPGCV